MLQEKLAELGQAIESKRAEVSTLWADFDAKRIELANGDHDLTDPESEAVKAADDAMKPYSVAAADLRTLEGQFERIALLAADGGADGTNPRQLNEHDRTDHAELTKSLGRRAVESDAYKALLASGALADGSQQQVGRHEIASAKDLGGSGSGSGFKSLLTGTSDAAGGALNVPERFPGISDLPQLPLGVLDLVTVGQTSSNAVEFVRILARTIAADWVPEASSSGDVYGGTPPPPVVTPAEAGMKPESGLTFEEALEAVRTIAHWIPATRNQMADAPFLQTLVESELITGVERKAEIDILQGSGTAPEIRGILNTPGIVSYAQSTNATDTEVDAVHRLLTLIRLGGYNPTAVGFNPLDWENIRLLKDGNENYVYGPPSQAGAMTIWGVRAIDSIAFPEDTPVAGEWPRALFLVREAARVLITDSHKDWFVRNLLALLAEARGVLVVQRPQAFGKVTFTA
jgi:predicted flap endonuclease-1-like 5' DNA nuclease